MLISISFYILHKIPLFLAAHFCLILVSKTTLSRSSRLISNKLGNVPAECWKKAACVQVNGTNCFGIPLVSSQISLDLAYLPLEKPNDKSRLPDVLKKRLKDWSYLRAFPTCWAVIQPLICSVYFPPCNNLLVQLPNYETCRKVSRICNAMLMGNLSVSLPWFLNCSSKSYKKDCKSAYDDLSYNTTFKCIKGLIEVPLNLKQHPRSPIPGCAFPCKNEFLYNAAQFDDVHTTVILLGVLSALCTLMAIFTILIGGSLNGQYPARILLFLNVCFLVATLAFLMQFFGSARSAITCRNDGTVRYSEPQISSGESVMCTAVFVAIYYPVMAALFWFVLLTYSWYLSFKWLHAPRETNNRTKVAYYHLISWSIPFVLTFAAISVSEIDGDPLTGVCFIGLNDFSVRLGFVILPVVLALACSTIFLVKGAKKLYSLKRADSTSSRIGDDMLRQISRNLRRLILFVVAEFLCAFVSIILYIYEITNKSSWTSQLDSLVRCEMNRTISRAFAGSHVSEQTHCEHKDGLAPNIHLVKLHVSCFFVAGILVASWVWNKGATKAWSNFIHRLMHSGQRRGDSPDEIPLNDMKRVENGHCTTPNDVPPNRCTPKLESLAVEVGSGTNAPVNHLDMYTGILQARRGAFSQPACTALSDSETSRRSSFQSSGNVSDMEFLEFAFKQLSASRRAHREKRKQKERDRQRRRENRHNRTGHVTHHSTESDGEKDISLLLPPSSNESPRELSICAEELALAQQITASMSHLAPNISANEQLLLILQHSSDSEPEAQGNTSSGRKSSLSQSFSDAASAYNSLLRSAASRRSRPVSTTGIELTAGTGAFSVVKPNADNTTQAGRLTIDNPTGPVAKAHVERVSDESEPEDLHSDDSSITTPPSLRRTVNRGSICKHGKRKRRSASLKNSQSRGEPPKRPPRKHIPYSLDTVKVPESRRKQEARNEMIDSGIGNESPHNSKSRLCDR